MYETPVNLHNLALEVDAMPYGFVIPPFATGGSVVYPIVPPGAYPFAFPIVPGI